jgi:hypothetical protein
LINACCNPDVIPFAHTPFSFLKNGSCKHAVPCCKSAYLGKVELGLIEIVAKTGWMRKANLSGFDLIIGYGRMAHHLKKGIKNILSKIKVNKVANRIR